ncbi:ribonuclease H-like domain-containing protein, partial [Tanacetum coccineum]
MQNLEFSRQVFEPTQKVDPSCAQHVKPPRQPLKSQQIPIPDRKNWNQMKEKGLGAGNSFELKKCFVCGSLSHLIRDCDFYEKKMAREAALKKQREVNTGNGVAKPVWTNANRVNHANQFVPRSLNLNHSEPNISFVRTNINTGRENVNSGKPTVNPVKQNVRVNVTTVPRRIPVHNGSLNVNTAGPSVSSGSSNINYGRTNFKSVRPNVHTGNQNVNSGRFNFNSARSYRPIPFRPSQRFSPERPK